MDSYRFSDELYQRARVDAVVNAYLKLVTDQPGSRERVLDALAVELSRQNERMREEMVKILEVRSVPISIQASDAIKQMTNVAMIKKIAEETDES